MADRIFRVYLKNKKIDNIVIYKPMILYEGKIKVDFFSKEIMELNICGDKSGTSMCNIPIAIPIPYDVSIYPNDDGKKEIVIGITCAANEEKFKINEDGLFSLRRINENLLYDIINESYELRYIKEKKLYEIGTWGDTPISFTFEGDKKDGDGFIVYG
jgi:hypothetical protein